MFSRTTAQAKIAKLRKRYRVVQGGTSASKTYSILPFLITYCCQVPNLEVSVVSESMPHLKRGCIRDFKKIMNDIGLWNESQFNKSDSTYQFKNGSHIEFFSADHPDKLRGARRDILFVNEANNIKWEAFHQLAMRTKRFIYIDFNPSHEFWAHTELQDDPNTDWLTLTYKDNEKTPRHLIDDFKKAEEKAAQGSEYWRNWVNVYIYGRLGTQRDIVFKEGEDWEQVATLPATAELKGYGLDFGYTNDPSACIAVFFINGAYYVDEVFYSTGMSNDQIAEKLIANGLDRVAGYADSAEPKSIDQIASAGCFIRPVQKGADSINYGIDLVRQHAKIYVTQRSLNLIKELRAYRFATDKKTGKILNKPEPNQKDHACDALRYWFMMGEDAVFSHVVV